MQSTLPGAKFNILMISCFSGMAHRDTNILKEGSTLWTTSDPSTVLASQPFRNALTKYPLGIDYDPVTFIKLMLLHRYDITETHISAKDIPHLTRDMMMKSVSGGTIQTYQLPDLKTIAWQNVKAPLERLEGLLGKDNPDYLQFVTKLLQCKTEQFLPYSVKELIGQFAPFLSFLALAMDSTKEYNPTSALPFVNCFDISKLVVSSAEYSRIFLGVESPSQISILDLLNIGQGNNRGNDSHIDKAPLIKSLLSQLCDESDTEAFASMKIACDIAPKHHTDQPGHVFRVVFISDKCGNRYNLIEIPLDDKTAAELLNGTHQDIYALLQTLTPSHYKEIASELTSQLALRIDNIEAVGQLERSVKTIWEAMIEKVSSSADPLSQKICRVVNKIIKKLVEEHKVSVEECTTPQEFLDVFTAHLKETHDTQHDVVGIMGSNGEVVVSCDMTDL